MATATLERTTSTTTVPAAPLTIEEQNALIGMAAANQRVERVRAFNGRRESRAWSLGGNVD